MFPTGIFVSFSRIELAHCYCLLEMAICCTLTLTNAFTSTCLLLFYVTKLTARHINESIPSLNSVKKIKKTHLSTAQQSLAGFKQCRWWVTESYFSLLLLLLLLAAAVTAVVISHLESWKNIYCFWVSLQNVHSSLIERHSCDAVWHIEYGLWGISLFSRVRIMYLLMRLMLLCICCLSSVPVFRI